MAYYCNGTFPDHLERYQRELLKTESVPPRWLWKIETAVQDKGDAVWGTGCIQSVSNLLQAEHCMTKRCALTGRHPVMYSRPPAMQMIGDTMFCKFTEAFFHRVITNDDGNESESVGTSEDSCLIFLVVKYGLILWVRKKQGGQKNIWTKAKWSDLVIY
jgi:hypothetical protein